MYTNQPEHELEQEDRDSCNCLEKRAEDEPIIATDGEETAIGAAVPVFGDLLAGGLDGY